MILIFAGFIPRAIAETGKGGYAGTFLELGLSARAVGMGQAYYAVSDDATAIFYNPAGAAQLLKRTAGFSYRVMDLDRKLGYVSLNFPVRDEATISVGWIFAGVDNVIERNSLGEPGNELDCSENAVSIAFARRFSKIVSIGGTGKYHMSKLANVTTSTVGSDLGVCIKLQKGDQFSANFPIDLLRIGAVIGNLGASYIWTTGEYWDQFGKLGDSRTDEFPLLIGGGVSILTMDRQLLVAADVRKYEWYSWRLQAGAEYTVKDILKLRAGIDNSHPTFGGGIVKSFNTYDLMIDYGFSASRAGERPDHIFSLGFAF